MLRTTGSGTVAHAASEADLDDDEWNDIDRYLDATRSELVFARRVLLVEGVTEQLMVPTLALTAGVNLDEVGISVCAIGGTYFGAYVKLCTALGIPWAVLTDGDPAIRVTGARRKELLVLNANADPDAIFVGATTFEHDVISKSDSNRSKIVEVLTELLDNDAENDRKVVQGWEDKTPNVRDFLDMISNVGGKGRFAQRLASSKLEPPTHLAEALEFLMEL